MSDVMLLGVLRMPMDDPDPLTLYQFVATARQAADRIESDAAELTRKSDAIQRLWRERDQLRAAAEEARRVLSMPILTKGDAPVEKALKMLDEVLGTNSDNTKVT